MFVVFPLYMATNTLAPQRFAKVFQQFRQKLQQNAADWQAKVAVTAKESGFHQQAKQFSGANNEVTEGSALSIRPPEEPTVKRSFLSQTLVTGAILALIVYIGYKYGGDSK